MLSLCLENLCVLLSNVIGHLHDSNALRVLKDLGTILGAVDKFTGLGCIKCRKDQVERDDVSVRYLLVRLRCSVGSGT